MFEACIPTRMRGKTTGKLSTGARNPAWLALEAMAPMRVNTLPMPATTNKRFRK